jgi:hypothetical protein
MDSQGVIAQMPAIIETAASHPLDEDEERFRIPIERIISEYNQDADNQTQMISPNGRTNSLHDMPAKLPISPPATIVKPIQFRALQKWEGYVRAIEDEVIRTRLTPLKGEGGVVEAEILIEEIGEEEQELIELGAIFYWTIGYLEIPSGRIRASMIRFRRLPRWTKHELEAAHARASELKTLFDAQ